jgi:predicted nucleic acid-binding protein
VIILDTNVLSALMRQTPEAKVVAWLDVQPRSSIWTTSITVLEVRFGLQIMPGGTRRTTLFRSFDLLLEKIDHRIAAFDAAAAHHAADLMAFRQKKGRPVELRDTMIAGIVLSRHAGLATHNRAHFEYSGIPLIDPRQA